MDIKIELSEKEAERVAKLLNQFGAWLETTGDRNTMGIARTAARDIQDKLANVRAAAGQDEHRNARVTPVKDVYHPAAKSNEQVKAEKWGVGQKTANGVTRFLTHSGIGDIVWVIQLFTKLAQRWGECIEICPVGMGIHRCEDLLSMSPNFRMGEWNDFDNEEITRLADKTDYACPEYWQGRTVVVTGNSQLERNKRLEDLCPSVDVTWYPPINTSPMHEDRALEITADLPKEGATVGIYTAGAGPIQSWGFWDGNDWGKVCRALHDKYGAKFVLIGAKFDAEPVERLSTYLTRQSIPFVQCLGEHFGVAVEVIKQLDLLLGFPSGLTITGGILKTPTCWWLPPKTSGYASGGNVLNIGKNWLPADQTHFDSRVMRKVDAELPDLMKSPVLLKALEGK